MTLNLILYNHYCRFVGRAISKALDEWGYHNPTPRAIANATKIVRWGYYEPINSNAPQINTRESIVLASSKLRAIRHLRAAGIAVPEDIVRLENDRKDIWFGRNYNHTGGVDIVVLRPGDPIIPKDYYTKYIEPEKEWRVHVFDGKVIMAQKKFFAEGRLHDNGTPIIKTEISDFVRSYKNGWRFYRIKDLENVPANVLDASIRAVASLGLTFGAVDVISHDRDENRKRRATVLEVNTAPGLDEGVGLDLYVEKFREWFNGK